MQCLLNHIFFEDFSVYVIVLFAGIGFFAGFFLKVSSQRAKGKFEKMEKEARLNEARIAELTEKLKILENENNKRSGTGIG